MQINVRKIQAVCVEDKIEYFDSVSSTNDVAKQRLSADTSSAGMVIANRQTAGRGTNHRKFYSPTSGIYFSIYLPIEKKAQIHPGRITANVGVIVAEEVQKTFNQQIGLKWVNDVYIDKRKVGGILCEVVTDELNQLVGLVIGIGLNITTEQFPEKMYRTGGKITEQASSEQVTDLLIGINQQIKKRRQTIQSDVIDATYLDLMILQDKIVEIDQNQTLLHGRVLGISPENELILDDGQQTQKVSFGRVISWRD